MELLVVSNDYPILKNKLNPTSLVDVIVGVVFIVLTNKRI